MLLKYFEAKGYKLHNKVISELEKRLAEKQKMLADKTYLLILRSEEEWREKIEEDKKYLQQINNMGEKFIRLKEKYKHKSFIQKREIYFDWIDYNRSLWETEELFDWLKVAPPEDLKMREEIGKDLRKEWLKREEIEKRFDQKLAD